MVKCSIIYSYFDNVKMLSTQITEWEKYPPSLKKDVEIIVVDDHSKTPINSVLQFPEDIKGRAFRLKKKVPFNFLACRNVGYHHASGKWVLNLDIDHQILAEDLEKVVELLPSLDERKIYLFQRIDLTTKEKIGSHGFCNLMTRQLFWDMGGYDERYSGHYHGVSGIHHTRFTHHAGEYLTLDIPLCLYNNTIVEDAINLTYSRTDTKADDLKFRRQWRHAPVLNMTFPYEEVLI